ncbi:MAG: hypothetical protein QW469_02625, partial [Candidatus Aenigmatarchaeota archaeon]
MKSYNYDVDKKIAQALEECGLTEEQIQQVSKEIKTNVSFLSGIKEDSSFWNFKEKIEEVVKK